MDEQLSLFGDEPANAAQQTVNSSGKLTVTQLSFVEGTEMTWKELFSGFDSLQQFEAERILKELPETLEAQRSRTYIIMKLDAAKEYFDIDFKKGFFRNR